MAKQIWKTLSKSSVSVLAVTYALSSGFAVAQTSAESDNSLDEVVVYATKKSDGVTAQDAPISLAAFGEQQLEDLHIVTIDDLGYSVPNAQLDNANAIPGVANLTIRGMGISASTPSIDPTVGIFVDGIYHANIAGSIVDTFDLESAEVLRGPQGVLFGRNVTAGALLLRTRRPDGETRVRLKAGVETGLRYTVAGSVEGSMGDNLAAKLAVYYSDDQGSINNSFLNEDRGKMQSFIIRPVVKFAPSDSFESTLIVEIGEQDGDGPQAQNPTRGNTPLDNGNFNDTILNRVGFADNEWTQVTSETNIDLFGGTLTNLLGYREVESANASDVDAVETDVFLFNTLTEQDQLSNELRWNGNISDNWDLTLGGYYLNSDLNYVEGRDIFDGAVQIVGGGFQDHTVYGLFVNNDVNLGDSLIVTGGLRWTREEKDGTVFALGTCDFSASFSGTDAVATQPAASNGCAGTTPTVDDSLSTDSLVPKLGLQYFVNDDVSFYAHWTKGFRSGGFNVRSNPNRFAGPTEEEEANAYEAGFKSSFAGNTVRLNGAVFQTDFDNLQRVTSVPTLDGQGVAQAIVNPADARIRGVELDGSVLLGGGLRLDAGIGLLDGEYTEVREDLTGDGIVNGDDLALDLLRLADFSGFVTGSYETDLEGFGNVRLLANWNYRSETAQNDANLARTPGNDNLNASITFSPDSMDGISFSVYGRNLTNNNYPGSIGPLPFAQTNQFSPLKRPRIIGAEIKGEF